MYLAVRRRTPLILVTATFPVTRWSFDDRWGEIAVQVDGRATARINQDGPRRRTIHVDAGAHQVTLSNPRGQFWSGDVAVEAGRPKLMRVTFGPRSKSWQIDVDGERLGASADP